MIEVAVQHHLSQQLDIPAYMEFPEDPPDCFIVIRKINSERKNHIDTSMILVESYAKTLYETALLNERVKIAMDKLSELDAISCSERAGDYPNFDSTNKRYRYQAVQNITHY